MGVVRIKQNVLQESSVGVLATAGDPQGRSGGWLGGVDLTYRTSTFLGDKRLLVGIWGLRNERQGLEGNKNAYGFKVDYPADLFSFALTSATIGDAVQPSLGFAPRTDVRLWNVGVEYNPRPGSRLVRQMYHEASVKLFANLDDRWESYEATFKPFDWLFESGDELELEIQQQGDRPPDDFAVFEPEADTLNYGGNLQTIRGTLALKPSPLFTIELATERNRGELPGGDFTQYLHSGRLEVKPSADFQVSSFLQYDNESRSFGTNTRLRWTYSASGELFVVYNHNMRRSLGVRERFAFESNQFLVKLTYGFRF